LETWSYDRHPAPQHARASPSTPEHLSNAALSRRVEMDTHVPSAVGAVSGAPAEPPAESPLAAEIRHSALLLGGALGLMGCFAVLLLLLTTRLGS
jgi:hypothetical protein